MQGWIKLHRELTDKAIWQESTPEQKTVLITVLMMANHKEREWEWKGEKFKAEPGQFVTSLEQIARKSGKGVSVQNVRTALKRFEKYDFLTNQSTNRNRLVSVVNWGLYQEENKNQQANQQATNKQLTTNKNDKNARSKYSAEFEEFWSVYPRKIDKKAAYAKFKTAIKNHPLEIILNGAEGYASYIQKENTEKRFIKHPKTFLHNDSFLDGYEQTSMQPSEPRKSRDQIEHEKMLAEMGR